MNNIEKKTEENNLHLNLNLNKDLFEDTNSTISSQPDLDYDTENVESLLITKEKCLKIKKLLQERISALRLQREKYRKEYQNYYNSKEHSNFKPIMVESYPTFAITDCTNRKISFKTPYELFQYLFI